MKKLVFFALGFIFMIQLGYSQSNFRETSWGMSKYEVKKNENSTLIEENENGLTYEGKLGNLKARIIYFFTDGKLSLAGYTLLKEGHKGAKSYARQYFYLKKDLTKKYGEPYRVSKHNSCVWKTDDTEISLWAPSEHNNYTIKVVYMDRNHSESKIQERIDDL